MDQQPRIIPVPPQERVQAQKNALEKLNGTRQTILTGTGNEVDIWLYVPLLKAAFQNRYNVKEACRYAKLPRRTYYNHIESNEKFREEMEGAQAYSSNRAKERLVQIIDKGDDRDAGPMVRWFLERVEPNEYGPRLTPNNPGGVTNNFFISVRELEQFFKSPESKAITEQELLASIETDTVDTSGEKKVSAAPVYTKEVQPDDTNGVNMPQSPGAV